MPVIAAGLKGLAVGLGILMLQTLQIRQVAWRAPTWRIVMVSLGISSAWLLSVHIASSGAAMCVGYAIGCAAGSVVAMRVKV